MMFRKSGKPFPLLMSTILIFDILCSTVSTEYRTENGKNSTLSSEISKNRRIYRNSRNSLTCDILNATQGPSLSLLFKPKYLQPNDPKSLKSTLLNLTPGPLTNRLVRKVSNLLMIWLGKAADQPGQVNNLDTLRGPPTNVINQPREILDWLSWTREAALKEEMLSWPQASLKTIHKKTLVSNRTKSNKLNYSRPSATWLFQGLTQTN